MATRYLDARAVRDEYLTALSLKCVRRWVSQRYLPVTKLGRRCLVSEAALQRWLASRTEPVRDD